MRRREFISVIAGAAVWPLGAHAQQPAMQVIGVLDPVPAAEAIPHLLAAFRRGLAEAGYVEGKNLAVGYRLADSSPELMSGAAGDLARLNVNVIFAANSRGGCRGEERNDQHSHRCARIWKAIPLRWDMSDSCAAGRQSDGNIP